MTSFIQPVFQYMTRSVESVKAAARLPEVARALERWNISAVPVVDRQGAAVGVVSRSDLLHAGRVGPSTGRRATIIEVPDLPVTEVMNARPVTVSPQTQLAVAARTMRDRKIHRLFVVENGQLVGVLSTLDLAAAVRDARIEAPIESVMTSPIVTIRVSDPMSLAVERLEQAHVTGLVVVEDDWPVGVFTQIEAMAGRDLPADTRVDDVFDQAMICMPASTKLHRAAAHAARLDVRRVIACRDREAIGVVGGLDFAKVVAG